MTLRHVSLLAILLVLAGVISPTVAEPVVAERPAEPTAGGGTLPPLSEAVLQVNSLLEQHWGKRQLTPAPLTTDAEFHRRISLDLLGLLPDQLRQQTSPLNRETLIRELLQRPEFSLYFALVLDDIIQDEYAGSSSFVDFLRRGLLARKSWDTLFQEMMVGPWKTAEEKAANRFLDKRAKTSDRLATDTARVFFGVNISCAKCHDHPLVPDWKQEHFYGMMAFFHRTTGGKGSIGEKSSGELKFQGGDGTEKTAQMMFLSGTLIAEPKETPKGQKFSPRAELVKVALDQKTFFARSFVNRMWDYFLGRGLVDPVDQMHSGNEPAISEVLDYLAADFIESDYDLRRLISLIVSSRAYQLSSRLVSSEEEFATFQLRPLNRHQFAHSISAVTHELNSGISESASKRATGLKLTDEQQTAIAARYLSVAERGAELAGHLDPRKPEFRSSVHEALYLSNHEALRELIRPAGNNLAARLVKANSPEAMIRELYQTLFAREPDTEELQVLLTLFEAADPKREELVEQLLWVALTSAEYRFQH